jgi:hypothetical protein
MAVFMHHQERYLVFVTSTRIAMSKTLIYEMEPLDSAPLINFASLSEDSLS